MAPVLVKNVLLGEGRAKVIVPITGRTTAELVEQAEALAAHDLDIVEWRVDYLDVALEPEAVAAAGEQVTAALAGRPVLFTFRSQAEGGEQAIDPATYVALNTALLQAGLVDAVDVELHFDREAGDAVIAAAHAAGIPVVGSSHSFDTTPPADEIVRRLVAMQERGCDVAKLAAMPQIPGDVLTLMSATWTMTAEHPATPVLTMSMAGLGLISRMATQVVGSCATFAMVGRPSAPGQIPVEQLQPILGVIDANL
ncbi:MAG: type I 3-dehydroquinate dehydratase [Propioniciclava sp.]